MILFRSSKKIRKRNPVPPDEVKEALDRFLDDTEGASLVRFLVRYWKDQQTVLTFKEIREAILAGNVTKQMLTEWRQDYSKMVAEKLEPTWTAAMEKGTLNETAYRGLDVGYKFRTDHWAVRDWLKNRTAMLVTNCTDEQKEAIRNIIADGIDKKMTVRELEKFIRPCIGLTKPQAAANLKYYNNIKEQLRKDHPRMSDASIEKKAREASMKYADRQLRQRAYTIAHTERASAYEYGRFQHTKDLMEEGFLPLQQKVWSCAGNESTCEICRDLDGRAVPIDENFTAANGKTVSTPPLHPLCRCCARYEDCILTRDEEKALVDYVGPNASYILNEKLRDEKEELTAEEATMRDNLDKALKRFPKYEGDLLRTVSFGGNIEKTEEFLDGFEVGKSKIFSQYLSFSHKTGYNDEAEIRIYVPNSKKARSLLNYGKTEGEALYARNQQFEICEKMFHDGKWYILMEED